MNEITVIAPYKHHGMGRLMIRAWDLFRSRLLPAPIQ